MPRACIAHERTWLTVTSLPTQSAFLELKEERVGMQEGYRFLDEKRLILAAESWPNWPATRLH